MLILLNLSNRLLIIFFFLQLYSITGSVQDNSVAKIKEIDNNPSSSIRANRNDSIPDKVLRLMSHYKDIIRYENNHLVFSSNNTKIKYNDFKEKNTSELLDNPDIEDMFFWK